MAGLMRRGGLTLRYVLIGVLLKLKRRYHDILRPVLVRLPIGKTGE